MEFNFFYLFERHLPELPVIIHILPFIFSIVLFNILFVLYNTFLCNHKFFDNYRIKYFAKKHFFLINFFVLLQVRQLITQNH